MEKAKIAHPLGPRHGMSQQEVADELGISRALVRQIEERALRKLRHQCILNQRLKDYYQEI